MQWLATFLVALLRAFLPALVAASKDTAEDAARQPELKARLAKRVRSVWRDARMWSLIPIVLLLTAGCFTRSIYVPDGTPVRLRETVRRARVWVMAADGKPLATEMDLPEGWYVLADPGEEE